MLDLYRNKKEFTTGCPVPKMTFSEITKFLQGGNEAEIQKTIAGHVSSCSSCREAIAQVEALREAGLEKMHAQFEEIELVNRQYQQSQSSVHLNEAQLAAFLDNGLPETELQRVAKHLTECYQCYRQVTTLKKALKSTTVETLNTSPEILEIMKENINTPFTKIKFWLSDLGNRLLNLKQRLWDLRWPVPALSFVVGVLLMLFITPGLKKQPHLVVVLPLIQTESQFENAHVLSELSIDKPGAGNQTLQIEIPYVQAGDILFRWPARQRCVKYSVEFYNASDNLVLKELEVVQNMLTLSNKYFTPGESYTILVKGIYQQGGVGPLVNMKFRFVKI